MSHRSRVLALVFSVLSFNFTASLLAQEVEGRIFFPTDGTVAIWEFNGFPELPDGTPLPDGTIVPDLSGHGLDATVEANGSDLAIGAGDLNFDTSPGANRELKRLGNANGGARLAVNDDQDLFEMPPEQDFSLELYVNRESTGEPVRWGILAGTWHSRETPDDTMDPNTQGAWYGYGLIRADENGGTSAPWSFVLNPLTGGVDGTPNIGCCTENHAFFDFTTGYHYLVLVVNRVDQTAITYLDGFEINRRTLNPDWSFTTPNGYEHARFTMFAGEDDPSRGTYRQSPAGVHLDAARVQRRAMAPEEVEETWNNILSGQPSPLPPDTLNALVTASSTKVLVNQCVKLDGSSSSPGVGKTITKYEWKVGTGAYEAGDPIREASFDAPNADGYPVSLRVTNSASETDEATVKIKVQKLDPVARIAASIAGQPAPGNDLYLPIGSVLTLDGTLSGYNVPSNALRCPIGDGLLIEPAPITGYAWDLDGRPATIEDTRGAFDSPPYNTAGDFRAILQVTAADGSKSIRTTLNVHVSDAQGNTRVFHNTPETVVHYEFNEFPDVFDGTPIPTGSVVEDLSGNGLNGTVAANDSGDLIMGPGVGSLDVPLGSNREVKHATVSNYAARIAVENDGDAFEMFPEDDFSIELYVNREATSDPVKWGILAGTWKSRNLLDDAAGDPNVFGAWYGYGLIRADEGRVAGPWSWVLSPLDGPDSPPRIGCCWENHAHFDIPNGRHYVALSVSRVNQTAITYVDGRQAGLQNLQPGWSFTTPPDYEHATFTLFSGEDDPSRNAYRPAPAGTELDAVRVQRTALTASEALENWQNIKQGKGANPEFAPTLPSAPAGLVATPGNGEVALDWSDNTEAGLQGYHVYRSDGGGPLAKITAQPVTESRYRDSGLTNGTEYCYRVAAVNASGAGPLSQAACAQPSGGGKRFKRADSDANGALDLTDVIAFLGYLFLGQGPLGCADAADADDSGVLDLTDAIYSLDYQYLGGPAPLDPGPETCGEDKTPGENGVDLGCDTACP